MILSIAELVLFLAFFIGNIAAPASALVKGLATVCFAAALCISALRFFLSRLSQKVFLECQGHLYRLYAYTNSNNPSLTFLKNWPDSKLSLSHGQTPEQRAAEILANPGIYLLVSEEIMEVYQLRRLPFCCHVRAHGALPRLCKLQPRSFFFITSQTLLEEFFRRQYEI